MKKLRRLLQSQRGDLLVDSLFAGLVLSIIMGSSGALVVAASNAASGSDGTTTRSILLNTVLSEEAATASDYTATPTPLTRTLLGQDSTVFLWQETTAGVNVLRASVSKENIPDTDCSNPANLPAEKCLTAYKALPASPSGGVRTMKVDLAAGTGGALHEFTVPAGAAELRYVFKATSVPAASDMIFANKNHPDAKHTVKIPTGQTGYYYGRIVVTAGDTVTLTPSGAATFDSGSFLIYKAPS